MSENNSRSAFSVHTKKRKNTEQDMNYKKRKNMSLLSKVSDESSIKQMIIKDKIQKRRNKDKCSLNISRKSKGGIVTKKGSLKTCKQSSLPTAKLMKPTNKLKRMSKIQQLDEVNNRSVHKKSKLKTVKQKKKTEKKICDKKGKIIEAALREIAEKENDDSRVNYINIEKYMYNFDPIGDSINLFEWLIQPLKLEEFFGQHWELIPLHIKRNTSDYYKWIVSTSMLDKILRDNYILFTKNIDITSYVDGVRETHNPLGRALPSIVWDYYLNDCSVRMLNPQTFIPQLHLLNATLQEFFGCFVGANLYLTPPNSQGFAPHYDDIEAFILQIEGKKRWRLYMPPSDNEYLARCPSKNFDQSEIGEPILDTIVNAGDLLYLPRGTIHQGMTIDNTHSLHVTISIYQRSSWCDLLERVLPQALKRATETNWKFRRGLPVGYFRYTGIAHSTNKAEHRMAFKEEVKDMVTNLINYIDLDSAADLMAKDHIHDFLPPLLSKVEEKCSVVKGGEIMIDGIVKNCVDITPGTKIRLLRIHCIRLIKEDEKYKIYYSTENSKEYHEYEPQFLEIDAEFVPSIQKIITSYPDFIYVKELPIEDDDIKIQIVKDLWEKSLIITNVPLVSSMD